MEPTDPQMNWIDSHWITIALVIITFLVLAACQFPLRTS